MEIISLYLHIPFCKHRCSYCDFNTYAGLEQIIPSYVNALCKELQCLASSVNQSLPVHTVYFGGGTPSLLAVKEVERILQTINYNFPLLDNAEISIEANPGTLTANYLHGLRDLGINRLSLGMQSAHLAELRLLERIHNYFEVIDSVKWARQAGFDNINLDLIFGIPGQSLSQWRHSLELALGLNPEHLSLYSLTIEYGTRIDRWINRGLLSEEETDLVADMYELAEEIMEQAGYQSYEISNWARYDAEENLNACRHNMQYWRGKSYLGLGAGAHGYVNHMRTINVLVPGIYINKMEITDNIQDYSFPITPATMQQKYIDPVEEMGEFMMMGLRLTLEGVSERVFTERFGSSLDEIYYKQIQQLIGQGLLEWIGNKERNLRITKRGRLLGNRVFREFI